MNSSVTPDKLDSTNSTQRIAVRRSSGMVEYLTPEELSQLNERKRNQNTAILKLYYQRNIAIAVAIISLCIAIFTVWATAKDKRATQPELTPAPITNTNTNTNTESALTPTEMQRNNKRTLLIGAEILKRTNTNEDSNQGEKTDMDVNTEPRINAETPSEDPDVLAINQLEPPAAGKALTAETHSELESSTSQTQSPASFDNDAQVLNALDNWSKAWSAKDPEKYLSYYVSHFTPESGISHDDWATQRRERLNKPAWINVSLNPLAVNQRDPSHIEVKVIQSYRSNSWSDSSTKLLTLTPENGEWKIEKEVSLQHDQ